MAHFAELDNNNTVLRVLAVDNSKITLANGEEDESLGVEFLQSLFGEGTHWKQTSYNSTFRKNYAGIGFIYDSVNDVFIVPQPYPSWLLDDKFDWQAPVPKPDLSEDQYCIWNEDTVSWDVLTKPNLN